MHAISTEVDYNDAEHKYFLGDTRYLSSTQIVDKFKNKFDENKWSLWMVYRYGSTQQHWLAKWKQTRDTSLVRGKEIHTAKEEYLYRRGVETSSGRALKVFRIDNSKQKEYLTMPDGIYPELKVWRHDYKIAGRADKVIISTETRSTGKKYTYTNGPSAGYSEPMHEICRVADVEDYKTNEYISREAYPDEVTGKPIMMLGPLSHLQDCDYNHYCLQLSLYQFMLEYQGFFPGYRKIIHYRHPIEGLAGTPAPKEIKVPYLRYEVFAMLDHLNLVA